MNSPAQAVAFLKDRAASGVQYPVGNCLGSVRDAYGSPAVGGDATRAYLATTERGPDAYGALAWWTGGSAGHGHVALSLGDGTVYSTDFGPDRYYGDGRVRLIALVNVSRQSNPAAPLVFQSFSHDLDGTDVLEAPMILVQKKDGGQVYRYDGNHIDPVSDHQVQRALGLGAVLKILNDTDEIFSLAPPGAPAQASSAAHSHAFSGTTGISG